MPSTVGSDSSVVSPTQITGTDATEGAMSSTKVTEQKETYIEEPEPEPALISSPEEPTEVVGSNSASFNSIGVASVLILVALW